MYTEFFLVSSELAMYIAGLSSFYFYKKLIPQYKLIGVYIWLSIIIDLFTAYFMKSTGYNLFLLPIYSLIELAIFSCIYIRFFLKKNTPLLQGILLLTHSLIILDFLFLCDLFNSKTFYAFSKVVADVTIILLCLNYYWSTLKEETPINKELLLLNSVFIGYFSINCLIFLSINFLVNESLDLVTPFWLLNAISVLFLYLFLTYMIWQHGKIQKISPSG